MEKPSTELSDPGNDLSVSKKDTNREQRKGLPTSLGITTSEHNSSRRQGSSSKKSSIRFKGGLRTISMFNKPSIGVRDESCVSEEEGFEDSFAELALLSRETNPIKKPLFSSLKGISSEIFRNTSLKLKISKQKSGGEEDQVSKRDDRKRSPLSSFENMRRSMVKIMPKIKTDDNNCEKQSKNMADQIALE
jgi:hypothetical protein